EKLLDDNATPTRTAVLSVLALALIGAATYGLAAAATNRVPDSNWSWLIRQAVLFVLSGAVVIVLASGKGGGGWIAALPVALIAADLIGAGIGYNPTARPEEVYPETESIRL